MFLGPVSGQLIHSMSERNLYCEKNHVCLHTVSIVHWHAIYPASKTMFTWAQFMVKANFIHSMLIPLLLCNFQIMCARHTIDPTLKNYVCPHTVCCEGCMCLCTIHGEDMQLPHQDNHCVPAHNSQWM
ncbi:hypothetical protein L208DRAFT_927743 [Tricholoma matsutake]|nr:hypothetical protein L208DRAFT_927743 [Tricholoma matsutake 945]